MGGKKKGGAKKGGKKGGDDDGEVDPSVMNDILTAKVQALKARLVLEQERRDNADAKVDEIRELGEEMQSTMEIEKTKTKEVVKKMTQIYEKMANEYQSDIEAHEKEVAA